MFRVDVTLSGPVFTDAAPRAIDKACDDIEREVAAEGERIVRGTLAQVLKHPTGFYESRIQDRPDGSHMEVTDQDVVYGPWLEGIGSRNYPKTRFKGYATFRKSTQALAGQAGAIAAKVLAPVLRSIGGR